MSKEIDFENYLLVALPKLGGGETTYAIGESLYDAIKAAQQTGKKASVTIRLEVKAVGGRGQIEIAEKITSKLPDFDRSGAIFFTDDDGRLHREDPRQGKLPFDEDSPKPASKTGTEG